MMLYDGNHRVRKMDATENLSTNNRVDFGLFEFSRTEVAGFVQDVIGYRQLSDIV